MLTIPIFAHEYSWPSMTSGSGIPAGMIMAWAGACPTGWSEYTAARGRYVVGVPAGGTVEATVGTALTDQENRGVAQHSHTVTLASHTHSGGTYGHHHTANNGSRGYAYSGSYFAPGTDQLDTGGPTLTNPNTSGPSGISITITDAGSVAGTNAPYVQLRLCKKN